MAWRLSRYQDFVANTTVIGAAFLNAVQDAITYLFLGSKTVKQLQADGTGDAAPDGTLAAGDIMAKCFRADGDGDDGAAIKSQALRVGGEVKLLWQIRWAASPDVYIRFYQGQTGLWITNNAVWNVGTSKWSQDDGGARSSLMISDSGGDWSFLGVPAGFGVWTDSDWQNRGHSTAGIAWAKIAADGTNTAADNCSVAKTGTGIYRVTIDNPPAANGAPMACINAADGTASVVDIGVNVYDVYTRNAAGSTADLAFVFHLAGQ